jgi:hypothetical protein
MAAEARPRTPRTPESPCPGRLRPTGDADRPAALFFIMSRAKAVKARPHAQKPVSQANDFPVTHIPVRGVDTRLAELEASNRRLLWMVFSQNSRIAALEVKAGLNTPRKRPRGVMVKQLADATGYSVSGLRKMAARRAAAGDPIGERHGGRLFLDPAKLPVKR